MTELQKECGNSLGNEKRMDKNTKPARESPIVPFCSEDSSIVGGEEDCELTCQNFASQLSLPTSSFFDRAKWKTEVVEQDLFSKLLLGSCEKQHDNFKRATNYPCLPQVHILVIYFEFNLFKTWE